MTNELLSKVPTLSCKLKSCKHFHTKTCAQPILIWDTILTSYVTAPILT